MLDKIPDSTFYMMAVAGAGGMVRLALGVKDDDEAPFWKELMRFVFVALPVGTLSGLYALEQNMGQIASFAVCYFAGTASLNIVRTMMNEGVSGIIGAFVRVKK